MAAPTLATPQARAALTRAVTDHSLLVDCRCVGTSVTRTRSGSRTKTSPLALRRKSEWHKRLMLLASTALLIPAAGRLDALIMVPLGLPRAVIGFWLTLAFVAWAWTIDWRRFRRIHPAYLCGGVALLISVPLRRWVGFTDAWQPIAKWLVGAPGG